MRVSRWGDSLAVRLPRDLVERMGLTEGDEVEVAAIGDRIVGLGQPDASDRFLSHLRALQKPVPSGFQWRREDAHERGSDDPDA